jgi:prepilin-type N-terminal cleavage/methylation domain-containing protein
VSVAASGDAARGFTLLELIVVLVILTGALSVVLPRLAPRLAASRVSSFASDLSAMAALARFRAVQEERDWVVDLALDPPLLSLAPAGPTGPTGPTKSGAPVCVRRLAEGVRVAWAEANGRRVEGRTLSLRFSADGTATPARLRLTSGPEADLLLEVLPAQGAVRARGGDGA